MNLTVANVAISGETGIWPYGSAVPTTGAALTSAYVASMPINVANCKQVDFFGYLTTTTGVTTVSIKAAFSAKPTPTDTAGEWAFYPNTTLASHINTVADIQWDFTVFTQPLCFQLPCFGNWMKIWVKANADAASSVFFGGVMLRTY